MSDFLTFLSNNYLYFLIAAGVLFFALLGFIVDLKKKKDDNNVGLNDAFNENSIPDVTIPNESQIAENQNINNFNNSGLDNSVNPSSLEPSENNGVVNEPLPTNADVINQASDFSTTNSQEANNPEVLFNTSSSTSIPNSENNQNQIM